MNFFMDRVGLRSSGWAGEQAACVRKDRKDFRMKGNKPLEGHSVKTRGYQKVTWVITWAEHHRGAILAHSGKCTATTEATQVL